MSISVKFNQTDVNRIMGKLRKIADGMSDPKGYVFAYRLLLLNDYKEAVVAAMGSVSATGGYAQLDSSSVTFGAPKSVYWKALAPLTVQLKGWTQGGTSQLTIWEDTGLTKDAVRVDERTGFVGIDKGRDPEAYRRALNTEFGGEGGGWGMKTLTTYTDWPSRPLFTMVNDAFARNRDEILLQIQKRIRHIAQQSGWGSA